MYGAAILLFRYSIKSNLDSIVRFWQSQPPPLTAPEHPPEKRSAEDLRLGSFTDHLRDDNNICHVVHSLLRSTGTDWKQSKG